MDATTENRTKAALSDYLAAERTLLAWIRTGLALMGFGFAAARFGLFLPQLRAAERATAARPYELSLWFGIALIAVGIFVNVFAGWHHLRLVRELDRGQTEYSRPSTQVAAIALLLGLIGLAMAINLISVRGFTGSH
jgi:putative membrane protein